MTAVMRKGGMPKMRAHSYRRLVGYTRFHFQNGSITYSHARSIAAEIRKVLPNKLANFSR